MGMDASTWRSHTMRFIVLVKASKESEAGAMPSKDMLAKMGRFNEEMAKAGVMLAGEGLQPSSKGARLTFSGKGKPAVTDGPFAESKELVAGFWIIKAASRQEAVDWISRAPFDAGAEVEIRQVFEVEDFPQDIFPPEEASKEQKLRDDLSKQYKMQ